MLFAPAGHCTRSSAAAIRRGTLMNTLLIIQDSWDNRASSWSLQCTVRSSTHSTLSTVLPPRCSQRVSMSTPRQLVRRPGGSVPPPDQRSVGFWASPGVGTPCSSAGNSPRRVSERTRSCLPIYATTSGSTAKTSAPQTGRARRQRAPPPPIITAADRRGGWSEARAWRWSCPRIVADTCTRSRMATQATRGPARPRLDLEAFAGRVDRSR